MAAKARIVNQAGGHRQFFLSDWQGRMQCPEFDENMPAQAVSSFRIYVLLIMAMGSIAMGQTLVYALLPLLSRSVGLSELQFGVVITASSAVYAWGTRLWGRRSDHLGRRRVMIIGLLGYTVGTLVFVSLFWAGLEGWLRGGLLWASLIVARCLQSSVMAATSPGASAYVADITTPLTRTAGVARLGAANSAGTIVGPAVGGLLAGISLLAPLYFAAGMTLVAALALWLCLPESPHRAQAKTDAGAIRLGYRDRRYMRYLLIGVAMLTAFSVIQQTLGFLFQDVLHLSSQATVQRVGIALMGSAVLALLAQGLLVQKLHWSPQRLILSGLLVLALGSGLLALASSAAWLFAGVALAGLGLGLCFPGCVSAATLAVEPEEQGALAGLTTALPALGSIAGPVLGTGLYQLHPHLPYLANVILLLPFIYMSWKLRSV